MRPTTSVPSRRPYIHRGALITGEVLCAWGACIEQVERFRSVWPEGVEVSLETLTQAAYERLDLDWFASQVLPLSARAKYYEEVDYARFRFGRAHYPLLAQYEEAVASALHIYREEGHSSATLAGYEEAAAPALARYRDAVAPLGVQLRETKARTLWGLLPEVEG